MNPYRRCSKTERPYEKKVHVNIVVETIPNNTKKLNTTFRLICWRKINKTSIPDVEFHKVTGDVRGQWARDTQCL